MDIGALLYEEAAAFVRKRFPDVWGGAAALYTEEGKVLISVALESANAGAGLCIETGAMCEAQKFNYRVTHSLCVVREDGNSPFKILTPCGICQERLFYWGEDVEVAITNPGNAVIFMKLKDINRHSWLKAYDEKDLERHVKADIDLG